MTIWWRVPFFPHSLVVSSLLTFSTFRLIFLFGSSLPWIFVPHLDHITILFPDEFLQKSESHFRTKPLRYSKFIIRFFVLWFENSFLTRNKDKQKECDKLIITCWFRSKLKPKLIQSRTCLLVSLPRFLCHLIDVWIWCKIYWYLKYSHSSVEMWKSNVWEPTTESSVPFRNELLGMRLFDAWIVCLRLNVNSPILLPLHRSCSTPLSKSNFMRSLGRMHHECLIQLTIFHPTSSQFKMTCDTMTPTRYLLPFV